MRNLVKKISSALIISLCLFGCMKPALAVETRHLRVRTVDGATNIFPVHEIQVTDGDLSEPSGGVARIDTAGAGGGGGAPTDATYITQTLDGDLSAEQALAALSTGIMRSATTTGVVTTLTDSAGIAANIDDETGTGVVVFSDSPILVTPALGTPASGVATNITALNATQLTTGSVPAARVAADHIDAITEIAAALKSGSDATLVTGTATNGECGQFNGDGDLVGSGGACGAGGGDNVTINGTSVDTTANFIDNIYSEWTLADGGAGGPDDASHKADYDQTLAGNPALEVDECIHFKDGSGGGFLCEGSTADTNEQLYRFPNVNGADTDENLAIGGGAFHDGFSDFVANEHLDWTGSVGTIDPGNVGAAHVDAITEIAAGLKTGIDLELVTGTATTDECAEFNSDGDLIGSGSACAAAADTNSIKEYWWPFSATLPLEAADSIPPIAKDAGTNIDQLPVDFDDTTDECRTVSFKVPSDVQSGSTITFRMHSYSAAATTGGFLVDFRHNGGITEGEDPDAALTTEAAAEDQTAGTAGLLTVTTWTETLANVGWAANDQVDGVFCRDADSTNTGTDDLSGDLRVTGVGVEIPRA